MASHKVAKCSGSPLAGDADDTAQPSLTVFPGPVRPDVSPVGQLAG